MSYKEFSPCEELKPYVECFWTKSTSELVATSELAFDKILPDGCIDFLFRVDEPISNQTLPSASIIGTMTASIDIARSNTKIIAVRFKAGGSLPFLSTPASLLTDQGIELASIWGDYTNQLIDEIFNTADLHQAIQVLEKVLLVRLRSSKNINSGVNQLFDIIETRATNITVDHLIQIYGKSARQLERIFLSQVGISPKMFLRIKRFQLVDRILCLNPKTINWADLAAKHGYFDQSHLIRDCKAMTGLTPENYRKFLKMSYFSNSIFSSNNI